MLLPLAASALLVGLMLLRTGLALRVFPIVPAGAAALIVLPLVGLRPGARSLDPRPEVCPE